MKTLHVGLRVGDPGRSLPFYAALGYEVVGQVRETPLGHLTMLKLPDDEFVSLELVHDPTSEPPGRDTHLSHLVVQVTDLRSLVERLAADGFASEEPASPGGTDDFLTCSVVDPDGNRVELVQWPPGHAAGMSAEDFAGPRG